MQIKFKKAILAFQIEKEIDEVDLDLNWLIYNGEIEVKKLDKSASIDGVVNNDKSITLSISTTLKMEPVLSAISPLIIKLNYLREL